jgi:hypothetical protein
MHQTRFAFCASTGRTATMFLASTIDQLPGVVGLHEGYLKGVAPVQMLPLINLQNRRAWYEPEFADRTVAERRDVAALTQAAAGAELLVDVAYYNSPLLPSLARRHQQAHLFTIFRRCEPFVRSATIVTGEDRQPAGWPDRDKPLTERERFIELGRLKPKPGTEAAGRWPEWSAIERNIWLWHAVNSHLAEFAAAHARCHRLRYEDLVEAPERFWKDFLGKLDRFSEANLAICMRRSAQPINQRRSYQVGPVDTWSEAEIELYRELALPLERELYD